MPRYLLLRIASGLLSAIGVLALIAAPFAFFNTSTANPFGLAGFVFGVWLCGFAFVVLMNAQALTLIVDLAENVSDIRKYTYNQVMELKRAVAALETLAEIAHTEDEEEPHE